MMETVFHIVIAKMYAFGSGRENNCSSMQYEHVVGICWYFDSKTDVLQVCCKPTYSVTTTSGAWMYKMLHWCDRFMNQRKAPAIKRRSSFLAGCCNPRRLSNQ